MNNSDKLMFGLKVHKVNKIYIMKNLLYIFLLLPLHLHATLSAVIVSPPTRSNLCNAVATITADGTAGPFEIRIFDKKKLVQSIPGVTSALTINDLCKKDYEVIAINRFGCEHNLGVLAFKTGQQNSARINTPDRDLKATAFSPNINVSPNPFSKSMFVTSSADYSGDVVVTIYDKLGRIIETTASNHVNGKNHYTIELEDAALPTGLLILEVHYVDQGVVERRKLVHIGE